MYTYNEFLKLNLIFFLFNISFHVFAIAPVSKLHDVEDVNYGITLEQVFLQSNPYIIDLSSETIKDEYPTKKHPFTSFLLINGDKKVKNLGIQQIIKDKLALLQIFEKTKMDSKYEKLYTLLQQIIERFNQTFGKMPLHSYIANVIRNDLNERGFSWRKLRQVKNFNIDFLILELLKNAIVHGNALDVSKPIFISWNVDDYGQFTLKVGDYSPAVMEENGDGLKKIINKNNDPEFNEKLHVAENAFLTGEHKGINYLQLMNNKRWKIKIELIMNVSGSPMGKYVVLQTSLKNEKIIKKSILNDLNIMLLNFFRIAA